MSDLGAYLFDLSDNEDPAVPPLPRADRRMLLDPAAWRAAERDCAVELAAAALAIGRLAGLMAGLDETMRRGMIIRLALIEVEAMLWAAGTPINQDVLIRDLAHAPASVDLEALSLARWSIGRLQGRGRLDALRDFLGLHAVVQQSSSAHAGLLRLTGADFDGAEAEFRQRLAALGSCHPLTRAAYGYRLWRLSDLSPDGHQLEAMCWAARVMADSARPLSLVPMGQAGRRVWMAGGDADGLLGKWCGAVATGCDEGFRTVQRLVAWAERARHATMRTRNGNVSRVIDALVAHPVVSAAALEAATAISRDTAERLLVRLRDLELVREVTGGKRFRLWAAAV